MTHPRPLFCQLQFCSQFPTSEQSIAPVATLLGQILGWGNFPSLVLVCGIDVVVATVVGSGSRTSSGHGSTEGSSGSTVLPAASPPGCGCPPLLWEGAKLRPWGLFQGEGEGPLEKDPCNASRGMGRSQCRQRHSGANWRGVFSFKAFLPSELRSGGSLMKNARC